MAFSSLQATWIRNSILRAVRTSAELDTRPITSNFVYDHPTIKDLASYVHQLVSGQGVNSAGTELKIKAMRELVQKYTNSLPRELQPGSVLSPRNARVVVVTGTTGSLGTHLLASLASDNTVSRIYALNRGNTQRSLKERQASALRAQGIEISREGEEKVVLLEVDLGSPMLGLDETRFYEVSCTLFIIRPSG
jgi:hypothetical protein